MPVPYTPLAVANEFIARFGVQVGIEHMKLQKLVYCSYGWWIGAHGLDAPTLTDEGPEVWRHGPVFQSLYRVLRVFGREPIRAPQSSSPFAAPDLVDANDEEVSNLINWVWARYGHLSSFALSDMTHKPGSPWHRVATDNNFTVPFNTRIPDEYIYEEYTRLMRLLSNQTSGDGGADDGRRRQANA